MPDEPVNSESAEPGQTQDPPEAGMRPAPDTSWMGQDSVRKQDHPDGLETKEG